MQITDTLTMLPVAIYIGLAVGITASLLLNKSGGSSFVDMILGVAGAALGRDAFFNVTKSPLVEGVDTLSVLTAIATATLLLVIYHWIRNLQARYSAKKCQRGFVTDEHCSLKAIS